MQPRSQGFPLTSSPKSPRDEVASHAYTKEDIKLRYLYRIMDIEKLQSVHLIKQKYWIIVNLFINRGATLICIALWSSKCKNAILKSLSLEKHTIRENIAIILFCVTIMYNRDISINFKTILFYDCARILIGFMYFSRVIYQSVIIEDCVVILMQNSRLLAKFNLRIRWLATS